LNESDEFSDEIFDNSDIDPLFCINSESDSNSSSEDENQSDNGFLQTSSNSNNAQPKWTTVSDRNQKHFNFSGASGPSVILDEFAKPINFFKLFLTNEIIQIIIDETNRNT